MKRSIVFALAAAAFAVAPSMNALAGVAAPALGSMASGKEASTTTKVKWLCGPYACHWIPNYAGVVYAVPRSRYWGPPPRPHCYYKKNILGNWMMVCP